MLPWAHTSPHQSPYTYNGPPISPLKLPLHMGHLDPHLIHGSLCSPEYPTQMGGSRWKAFRCHQSRQNGDQISVAHDMMEIARKWMSEATNELSTLAAKRKHYVDKRSITLTHLCTRSPPQAKKANSSKPYWKKNKTNAILLKQK